MIRRKLPTRYSMWNKHRKLISWKNKLIGIPAFIVGNSPDLNRQPVHLLNGLFTIGINRAFKKIETTILMWQDIELYISCKEELKNTKSILYSRDLADPKGIAYHFRLLNLPYRLTGTPLRLAGRGSTGPLAFQLAHCLGCNPIIFVGCDCRYDGKQTDFWGVNKDHKPHTLQACSRGVNWIKNCGHKRSIMFCSTDEKETHKKDLREVLKFCKIDRNHYHSNKYFEDKLFG